MQPMLLGAGLLLITALWAGFSPPRMAGRLAVLGQILGLGLSLPTLVPAILGGSESYSAEWPVPLGRFSVGIDPLSAVFLIPVLLLGLIGAVYGLGYFRHDNRSGRVFGFFNLLTASMILVVLARNGLLFLVAWEVMSVASFFLVTHNDEDPATRRAGWTYLVFTHAGTAFLIAFFSLSGRGLLTLDFPTLAETAARPAMAPGWFLLALVGFGTKAGLVPFHVWLPEAHPAAPSPVSAVMSGAMIKLGLYGILRAATFFDHPPLWWGWTLILIGALTGILGVLFALAQQDIKRLLAYSSVENVGIITLGLGMGFLGRATEQPGVATLGFAGALFHVLNHALFKGLLFLGTGTVVEAVHGREIDRFGGLLRRMPRTGLAFFAGAAAISGLPPFNGFAGELLTYFSALSGLNRFTSISIVPSIIVLAAMALIGGLALACFAKAFGISFLGEPRSEAAAAAHEGSASLSIPPLLMAAACLGLGLGAPLVLPLLAPVAALSAGLHPSTALATLEQARFPLTGFTLVAMLFLLSALLVSFLRRGLLAGRPVGTAVTWDCGYSAPNPRMQYTGSSFAAPLVDSFRGLILPSRTPPRFSGPFPSGGTFRIRFPDHFLTGFYSKLVDACLWFGLRIKWVQRGRIQLYLLYILLTLILVLIWKLW